MKLYITEILKEANEIGFGAPGQGGSSQDVAFSQTSPGPSMPLQTQPPPLQPQSGLGGMMLPPMNNVGGLGMQPQLNLTTPSFKPTI